MVDFYLLKTFNEMGVREQENRSKTLFGQDNNALFNLIAINVIAFVILYFVLIIYYLSGSSETAFTDNVLKWFTVPAKLGDLLYRPWLFSCTCLCILMYGRLLVICFGYGLLVLFCRI